MDILMILIYFVFNDIMLSIKVETSPAASASITLGYSIVILLILLTEIDYFNKYIKYCKSDERCISNIYSKDMPCSIKYYYYNTTYNKGYCIFLFVSSFFIFTIYALIANTCEILYWISHKGRER